MGEEIEASPEHVEALLTALSDRSDQLHCLREYLFDQTPADFREVLAISFGAIQEDKPRARADSLRTAIEEIENAATDDADLRRLVIDLAKVVGFSGSDARARAQAAGGRGGGGGQAAPKRR